MYILQPRFQSSSAISDARHVSSLAGKFDNKNERDQAFWARETENPTHPNPCFH